MLGGRHDDAAVCDVEVRIARGERLAVELEIRDVWQLDHLERPAACVARVGEDLAIPLHQRVVRVGRVVAGLGEHDTRSHEGADAIDVSIGVRVLETAPGEPDHLGDAEARRELLLDLLARHPRVAVGVKQALLGGDQGALAVDRDRASLEHHGRCDPRDLEQREQLGADGCVEVVGQEALAPRVEREVDAASSAGVIHDHDRTRVAQPRVVDRQLHDLDR